MASYEGISVWEKQADENIGWDSWELEVHEKMVRAIAFQLNTFLLALASEDGQLCLWQEAEHLVQIIQASCLFHKNYARCLIGLLSSIFYLLNLK